MIVREELDLGLVWARDNPELFVQAVDKFVDDHPPALWSYEFQSPHKHGITYIANRKPPVCEGCGNEIDPDWCHCGDRCDHRSMASGHSPVPMGCVCGYAQ